MRMRIFMHACAHTDIHLLLKLDITTHAYKYMYEKISNFSSCLFKNYVYYMSETNAAVSILDKLAVIVKTND